MSAGKGSLPRPVHGETYRDNFDEIFRNAKERIPIDLHRRKYFTGLGAEICPGFHAKEFMHGTPDDDPADLDR